MSPEIYWLTLTAVMTGLMWAPYILNRIAVRGLFGALANPSPEDKAHSGWAVRAHAAHMNAVENLVVFGAVVLAGHAAGALTETTALAAMIYFWVRLAHFVVYTFGIPFARTLTFAAGMLCQLAIGLTVLGVM